MEPADCDMDQKRKKNKRRSRSRMCRHPRNFSPPLSPFPCCLYTRQGCPKLGYVRSCAIWRRELRITPVNSIVPCLQFHSAVPIKRYCPLAFRDPSEIFLSFVDFKGSLPQHNLCPPATHSCMPKQYFQIRNLACPGVGRCRLSGSCSIKLIFSRWDPPEEIK